MICVPQRDISRIVTLDTSGTTGNPKRVFFTEEDQELTVDFFHHGMQLLIGKADTVMILMPCRMAGSVGDLLREGIERIGAKVIPYGLPETALADRERILDAMEKEQVTCTVALAAHMAELAKHMENRRIDLRCTLLSADYVSGASRKAIREGFGCDIFEHYGMTETGLGGAVSCQANVSGYHVREADLYFELIDPKTGKAVPDGQYGEIVLTTLTRKGMPFIRYRTGDISRWLSEPCDCGSVIKRLDRVEDRRLAKGGTS
jgi:phenylacetate-coenzyme A ligase PaaK-like adenylate-forming protein